MPYILKNTETGKYVAPQGSPHSYIADGAKARRYATREDAERDRCPGNETIIDLSH